VNWTALSPESRASLRLAALICSGLSPAEAGRVYGLSEKRVKAAIADLGDEIRAQIENAES
jgi:DNA-binding CsgD family transcriptional regulator